MPSGLGTAINPDGVSGEVTTVAPPQQQNDNNPGTITATTAIESVEYLLYRDWIWHDTYTIDTQMSAGHIIAILPNHPSLCNQYVAHVATMFNAWNGGFRLRARFMATAFYGGSFRIGFLPPNLTTTQIRSMTIKTLTAYPNQDLDPKNVDWLTFSCSDERSELFHWGMKYSETDRTSFGGYVVLYVAAPLVTQDASIHTISLLLETAGNYVFAQPNPLFGGGDGPTPGLTGPLPNGLLVDMAAMNSVSSSSHEKYLVVLPATSSKHYDGFQFARGINGSSIKDFGIVTGSEAPGMSSWFAMTDDVSAYTSAYVVAEGSSSAKPMHHKHFGFGAVASAIKVPIYTSHVQYYADRLYKHVKPDGSIYFLIEWSDGREVTPIPSYACLEWGTWEEDEMSPFELSSPYYNEDQNEIECFVVSPRADESIVWFVDVFTSSRTLQPEPIRRYFLDHPITLTRGVTYVYSLRNSVSDVPITYFRLNECGIFTTYSSDTGDIFVTNTSVALRLVFEFELPATSPLPSHPASSLARKLRRQKSHGSIRDLLSV